MSTVSLHVTETVIAFTMMVIMAYLMKRKGMLKQEDSNLFAKLLTQAILPATIFYQLWTNPLSGESLAPVLVMFLSGTVSLAISWFIGVLLKFDRQSTGALMIVSSFGSSALIGYPIIQYAFANNPQALAHGIIISELGVGLPIFIFCPAVAMYFGGKFEGVVDMRKLAKDYFLSPIFVSVVLGLSLSHLDVPVGTPFVDTIMEALKMMQGALVVLSAVILGLQLSFQPMKVFWKLIMVSILIQMLFQPWFSDFASGLLNVSAENRQILVLVSAMPAAILGPVFAARYDCAAKTATLLAFTHIAISPVIVPAVFALFT
jgi:predicted permease